MLLVATTSSNGDKYKTLSIIDCLDEIKPYLSHIRYN